MIARLWKYLHQSPGWTWIGHGLQGFWWGVLADLWPFPIAVVWVILAVMFGVREGEGIVRAVKKRDWPNVIDGVMDLATPFLGLTIYQLIS